MPPSSPLEGLCFQRWSWSCTGFQVADDGLLDCLAAAIVIGVLSGVEELAAVCDEHLHSTEVLECARCGFVEEGEDAWLDELEMCELLLLTIRDTILTSERTWLRAQ